MNTNTKLYLEEFVSAVRDLATELSKQDESDATDKLIVAANTLIAVLDQDETIKESR